MSLATNHEIIFVHLNAGKTAQRSFIDVVGDEVLVQASAKPREDASEFLSRRRVIRFESVKCFLAWEGVATVNVPQTTLKELIVLLHDEL